MLASDISEGVSYAAQIEDAIACVKVQRILPHGRVRVIVGSYEATIRSRQIIRPWIEHAADKAAEKKRINDLIRLEMRHAAVFERAGLSIKFKTKRAAGGYLFTYDDVAAISDFIVEALNREREMQEPPRPRLRRVDAIRRRPNAAR